MAQLAAAWLELAEHRRAACAAVVVVVVDRARAAGATVATRSPA
jgi:hypothetical protein